MSQIKNDFSKLVLLTHDCEYINKIQISSSHIEVDSHEHHFAVIFIVSLNSSCWYNEQYLLFK